MTESSQHLQPPQPMLLVAIGKGPAPFDVIFEAGCEVQYAVGREKALAAAKNVFCDIAVISDSLGAADCIGLLEDLRSLAPSCLRVLHVASRSRDDSLVDAAVNRGRIVAVVNVETAESVLGALIDEVKDRRIAAAKGDSHWVRKEPSNHRPTEDLGGPAPMEVILLVTTDATMLGPIEAVLRADYDVQIGRSMAEGLSLARKIQPSAVVVDTTDEAIEGLGLIRSLQEDVVTWDIPIVTLAASDEVTTRIAGQEGGAETYLLKPFQPRELQTTIRSILKKQQQHAHAIQDDRTTTVRFLTEGIAHEILNPLGFVQHALFAMRDLVDELTGETGGTATGPARLQELKEEAQNIYRSGKVGLERVRQVVDGLKRLFRKTSAPMVSIDVREIIDQVFSMVHVRGYNIVLKSASTKPVYAKPGQIEQVIINLVLNAQQAGGPSCEIQVRTRDESEGGVSIAVSDNGPGIAPENIEKIFQPFFTTKDPGKGMGLGLALSRQIVAEHGGKISVSSALGRGTTFTIWLPGLQDEYLAKG